MFKARKDVHDWDLRTLPALESLALGLRQIHLLPCRFGVSFGVS